jgi:hypothetical protein
VLLVGSSFTQQGIDPEVLAEILGESGRRITVLPLAIGGLSHLERLYYLKEYLPMPSVRLNSSYSRLLAVTITARCFSCSR